MFGVGTDQLTVGGHHVDRLDTHARGTEDTRVPAEAALQQIPAEPGTGAMAGGKEQIVGSKRGGQDGFYVRTSYVTQTLDQLRDATPLSMDSPPARAPIFVPGSGGLAPNFDAPLASYVRQARKVIDPSFIAPEP